MKRRHWVVAGGLGFIGSAFVRMVLGERADVDITVLDALTYAGNPANLALVAGGYRFVKGDICDPVAVLETLSLPADAIINFAAETHVDRSIHDPGAFLRTGVLGVQSLLDAVRARNIPRFLQVSTDEVYGDVAVGASAETDPLRPRSPYAASKAAGDLLAMAYHATYDAPVLITRGSNTYGPYQYPEKLVPLFTTNLLDGDLVPVYGDGRQVREWLHVDDHARGILHVLEHGSAGHVYNLGGGRQMENRTLIERLLDLTGRRWDDHVRLVRDREGHDRRYALDAGKMYALGWTPRMDFDVGLAATVDWYRSNEAWWRPIKTGEFRTYYEAQYASR